MYYINKIVGWVFSPVGIALFGLVVAFALRMLSRRERYGESVRRRMGVIGKWLAWTCCAWLWLWSTPLMSRLVGATLEREFLVEESIVEAGQYPEADAIILLGGSMGWNEQYPDHAEMWASADRVWMAAQLFKAGKAPVIIASGGHVAQSTGQLLRDFEVPEDAVVFDDQPRNTEEEAKAIQARGFRKVLLVTSAWHMKRARTMFEKYAPVLEIVTAPTDFEATYRAAISPWCASLIPASENLWWNEIWFHEWLGIVGYKLFR